MIPKRTKFLSILMVLVMAISLLPVTALAVEETASSTGGQTAALDNLRLFSGSAEYPLSPDFSSDVESYSTVIPDSVYFSTELTLKDSLDAEEYSWGARQGDKQVIAKGRPMTTKASLYPSSLTGEPIIYRVEKKGAEETDYKEYRVNIEWLLSLKTLKTDGTMPTAFSNSSDKTDYQVFISNDAETFDITAAMYSADQKLTINGDEATSGNVYTLELANVSFEPKDDLISGHTVQAAEVEIKLTAADTDKYKDNAYTLTLIREPQEAKPYIITQTFEDATYIVNSTRVSALSVTASALGGVSYQWYKNETNSTSGGTAIEDATDNSYTPPTAELCTYYYYCVITGHNEGEDNIAVSDVAEITVQPEPTFEVWLETEIPDIPEEYIDLFPEDANGKGFYYEVGTEEPVTELLGGFTVENLPPDCTVRARWPYKRGNSSSTGGDNPTTPPTDKVYGLCVYTFEASVYYNGVTYSSEGIKVYVYVGEKPEDLSGVTDWDGEGTEYEPWQITSTEDMEKLRDHVNDDGYSFTGRYFEITDDLDLGDWTSIGALKSGQTSSGNGKNINVFSGVLNGRDHTLTFASGSQPLFGYVREATVKNLAIYGPYIVGNGLVANYTVDYGSDGDSGAGIGGSFQSGIPDTVEIVNVTLKSGSVIGGAGFIGSGGFASGGNTVTITDCTVEKGVKIGCDLDGNTKSNIGSFAANFNGTITGCISYADVYGVNSVGGIVGSKGQSMGPYKIINCAFSGNVHATGNYVGGIAGAGYTSSSAPNTPCATIQNCLVNGNITGADYVGGIFGGEIASKQCWDSGTGYIQNNLFTGTVSSDGEYVGGVIGYMNSLNKYNIITNNYYEEGCGADYGIGYIRYIDSSNEFDAPGRYEARFDSSESVSVAPGVAVSKKDHNRTDDPLGADADELAAPASADDLSNGTTRDALNSGENSLENWTLTEDGSSTVISILLRSDTGDITVYFSLFGDEKHNSDTDGIDHTLKYGNLLVWIDAAEVSVPENSTVMDALAKALTAGGYSWVNDKVENGTDGNYIESITTPEGLKLGAFTNGELSGWMYTLNGVHTDLGVSQQPVKDGDKIVLHYTDNYLVEYGWYEYSDPYKITDMTFSDSEVTDITIKKNADISEDARIYVSFADKETERLLGVYISDLTADAIAVGDTEKINVGCRIPEASDGVIISVFIWNAQMMPLAAKATF